MLDTKEKAEPPVPKKKPLGDAILELLWAILEILHAITQILTLIYHVTSYMFNIIKRIIRAFLSLFFK